MPAGMTEEVWNKHYTNVTTKSPIYKALHRIDLALRCVSDADKEVDEARTKAATERAAARRVIDEQLRMLDTMNITLPAALESDGGRAQIVFDLEDLESGDDLLDRVRLEAKPDVPSIFQFAAGLEPDPEADLSKAA